MQIPNDPGTGAGGSFRDLLRLQTEFQARLAEETVKYLRRLQGAGMPAAPGTVLHPDEGTELNGKGPPGATVRLELEVLNRQRVHSIVTPMLEALVGASGITWFPEVEPAVSSTLVPPNESRPLALTLKLPDDLPAGTYRGALLLQGFRDGAVPVAVEVEAPPTRRAPARTQSSTARKKSPRRRGTKS
ncbi:MAG: hypothetical protein M3217_10855 [Actinomycetota bacterium]|nr:hypothetical protein [Actinomycetota bacterium]